MESKKHNRLKLMGLALVSFIIVVILALIQSNYIVFEGETGVGSGPIEWCYQETANVSTDCGGLSTGVYYLDPNGWINMNYTKPELANGSTKWQVKHGALIEYNVSIDVDCWSAYNTIIVLRFRAWLNATPSPDYSESYGQCYNTSDWINITNFESGTGTYGNPIVSNLNEGFDGNLSTYIMRTMFETWISGNDMIDGRFYEEGVYWAMDSCANNNDCNSIYDGTEDSFTCGNEDPSYPCANGNDGNLNTSYMPQDGVTGQLVIEKYNFPTEFSNNHTSINWTVKVDIVGRNVDIKCANHSGFPPTSFIFKTITSSGTYELVVPSDCALNSYGSGSYENVELTASMGNDAGNYNRYYEGSLEWIYDNKLFCNQSRRCVDDLVHSSFGCNSTYKQTTSEFNGSCFDGECWNNGTVYQCNRIPTNFSSPNDILNITCKNWNILNWTDSASDPDGDSIYYNVKVGSTNGSSDYGTGTTKGGVSNDEMNATGLTKIRGYYWELQTCDNHSYCIEYNNSDWDTFNRTNCAPSPPTNLIPVNDSSSLLPFVFTWTTGIDTEDGEDTGYDANRDYFCIQTQLNITNPCWNSTSNQSKSISDDNEISLDTPIIVEDVTYYWAMRTDDGYINSSWIIFKVQANATDINLVLSSGVTAILFYPNESNSMQVEPECQTPTVGCINVSNRRGYTINISVSTNITYPLNFREGDTNWDFEYNSTVGNMSLWSSLFTLSLSNRSESVDNIWALNVSY